MNQGNQVGAGAELAAILNDIIDSIPAAYTLPAASAETLGGVKVGQNLSITEGGVLSASGSGAEPLIVEGTKEDTEFIPNSGQPSLSDAISLFHNGGCVILKYPDEEDVLTYGLVTREYDNILYFGALSWS